MAGLLNVFYPQVAQRKYGLSIAERASIETYWKCISLMLNLKSLALNGMHCNMHHFVVALQLREAGREVHSLNSANLRTYWCVCLREEPRAYLRCSLPQIPVHNIIWKGWKCYWISIAICPDPWGRLSNLSLTPTSTLTSNKSDMKWNLEHCLSHKSITQPNHFKLRRTLRWVAKPCRYMSMKNKALNVKPVRFWCFIIRNQT